jgi:hypothetical protein
MCVDAEIADSMHAARIGKVMMRPELAVIAIDAHQLMTRQQNIYARKAQIKHP